MFSFLSMRLQSRFISVSKVLIDMNRSASMFSLRDYDCVGFDLDHTLCSYRLDPLHRLIYSTLATFLVEEKGYPRALLQMEPKEALFSQKGLVLDKQRGNILKLDSGYRIDRATHGTRLMSTEEVERVYGPERMFENDLVPRLAGGVISEMPFYIFKDAFVTPAALLCGKIVDLLDAQNDRPALVYEFFNDYLEGVHRMYDRENFGCGGFFPELRSNPEKYLAPCSEGLLQWLEALAKTKLTFVVTSANYDAADFVAKFCIGEEWRRLFDSVITFAKKPGFFFESRPFLDEFGAQVAKPCKGNVFSEGNFEGLRQALSYDGLRVLYCGDSLVEDVYAGNVGGKCDTVAIVDEMKCSEEGLWGSFFSVGDKGPSLWANLISSHSQLAVADLDTLAKIKVVDRVPAFDKRSQIAGYYPRVPQGLTALH